MAAPRIERRIAAIFAADVSGYSRLMAASEEGTLARLKEHRRLIDGLIAEHRGRFVGSAGDSVLAEFASPIDAVACAVAIQRELGVRNSGLSDRQRMEFRIGINLGDVMVDGPQIYGDGVNIAARLEGLAEPGGIAISGSILEQVARKLEGVSFESRGRQRMKNIPEPVRVFDVNINGRAKQDLGRLPLAVMGALLLAFSGAVGFWYFSSRSDPRPTQVDIANVELIRDCAECPELVRLPGGIFTMGSMPDEEGHQPSEGPARKVSVSPFAIGRFEATFAQWDGCVADGACRHKPNDRGWGRGTRPVIYVSWQDVQEFLGWISKKTGKRYRLPSEAEWEYVARAGTKTRFWWGDEPGDRHSNCIDCGSADSSKTTPVGSFQANPFGLYDMHGNTAEWTADCWNGSYAGAPNDGSAWLVGECDRRVVRGGAWGLRSQELRSAYRSGDPADLRSGRRGFRVARDL